MCKGTAADELRLFCFFHLRYSGGCCASRTQFLKPLSSQFLGVEKAKSPIPRGMKKQNNPLSRGGLKQIPLKVRQAAITKKIRIL